MALIFLTLISIEERLTLDAKLSLGSGLGIA